MLLQKAKLESAFFKYGVYGGNGSGKSFTTSLIAIGLHKYMKAKKPIAFVDSETGSDFVLKLFKKEKIELMVAKTRSFADLLTIIEEAEKNCFGLIIDSVTHYWDDLVEGYKRKNKLKKITHPSHWMVIKPMWREFSEKYVISKLHTFVCGRAGDVWEDVEDDEGVKELKRTGTRMRVEKELGYEPFFLVEMEKARLSNRAGAGWTHRAWVVKDRFDVIDSQCFDNPTFESFLPHIELLNLKGEHRVLEQTQESSILFNGIDNSGEKRFRQIKILQEKISKAIYRIHPGKTDEAKLKRDDLMKQAFGTVSWTEVCSMQKDDLENGLSTLEKQLNKKGDKKNEPTSA